MKGKELKYLEKIWERISVICGYKCKKKATKILNIKENIDSLNHIKIETIGLPLRA